MGILLSRIFGIYPMQTIAAPKENKSDFCEAQLRKELFQAIDEGMKNMKEKLMEDLQKQMETIWKQEMEALQSRVEELAAAVAKEKPTATEDKSTEIESEKLMGIPGAFDKVRETTLPPPETKKPAVNPPKKMEEVVPTVEPEKPEIQLPPKSEAVPAVGPEKILLEDLPKPGSVPATESKESTLPLEPEAKSDKSSPRTNAFNLPVRGRGRDDLMKKTSPKPQAYRSFGRGRISPTSTGTLEFPQSQMQEEIPKCAGISMGSPPGEGIPKCAGRATGSLQGKQMELPPFLKQHFMSLKARDMMKK